MVLNFIAKLKDIRAQLVRKSVQHPGLVLSQSLATSRDDSPADQDPTKRAAAAAAAAALSSAGTDQDDLEPEATAPSGSLASPAQPQPSDEDSEEEAGDSSGDDPDADDVPEQDPKCALEDCSDLKSEQLYPTIDLSNGAHPSSDVDSSHPSQILVQDGQQQTPPYQVPEDPAPIPPVGSNELFPLIQVQPEFVERQINAADRVVGSSSSWLLVAILFASMALIVLTLRLCERFINQMNEVGQV